MKKFVIEWDFDTQILVSPNQIERGLCRITSDDDIYRYNEDADEMELIYDEYVSQDDDEQLYEPCESLADADVIVDEVGYVKAGYMAHCYDWTLCHIEYGINSEYIEVSTPDFNRDMIEVDVERVDYIPQSYPNQEYVAIYEGVDEDGKKIQIRETHPFFEDSHYPTCEVTYLAD